jgi:catechol 2,3-dioxygenase-like lactoylglutathione lyase family enzyme
MSPIRHFDHVGITVRDLDTVTAFFVGLGFETEGRTVLEGEFLDTVIGIPNSVPRSSCCGRPAEEPGWNCRASSAQTANRVRPTPCTTTGVAQRDVRGGRSSGDPRPARRRRLPPCRRRRPVRGHLAHGVCARTQGFIVNLAQRIN